MDLELGGKTALVTGASRGIGRAIALGLAKEGARVALCARNPTPGYLPGGIANAGLVNFTKGLADLGAGSLPDRRVHHRRRRRDTRSLSLRLSGLDMRHSLSLCSAGEAIARL